MVYNPNDRISAQDALEKEKRKYKMQFNILFTMRNR